jgi:hypothetical protein
LQKDREKLGKIGKTETGFDKRLEQQFVWVLIDKLEYLTKY